METTRRMFIKLLGAATASAVVAGMPDVTGAQSRKTKLTMRGIGHPWFTPNPPAYPHFVNRNDVIAEAQAISDRLEQHIKDWFDGRAAAQLPPEVIPAGIDTEFFVNFTLVRPEDISPEEQWGIRPAEEINLNGRRGSFPDPHCTYLIIPALFLPFGSRVIPDGELPHCRFFDVQITPTFRPEDYHYNGSIGVGEVPIVDVDNKPQIGSANPFLPNANRNAKPRRYQLTFDMAIGNPVDLNPVFRPPFYRAPGNNRKGGALFYQGAWGDPNSKWDTGAGFGIRGDSGYAITCRTEIAANSRACRCRASRISCRTDGVFISKPI